MSLATESRTDAAVWLRVTAGPLLQSGDWYKNHHGNCKNVNLHFFNHGGFLPFDFTKTTETENSLSQEMQHRSFRPTMVSGMNKGSGYLL